MSLLAEMAGHFLCHGYRRNLTVMRLEHGTDIVGNLDSIEVIDEQFFGTAGKVRGARYLNLQGVVEPLLARPLRQLIAFFGVFIEPDLVVLDFLGKALSVASQKFITS